MTKIKFKKWRLYSNLIFGLIWTSLATIDFLYSREVMMGSYGFLGVGILYLGCFLYDYKNQYLKVKNHSVQKNFLHGGWNKKINLYEVICIEKTYLHYTLKIASDKLEINADLIEDESYKELKAILSGLNLPEDKRPALL